MIKQIEYLIDCLIEKDNKIKSIESEVYELRKEVEFLNNSIKAAGSCKSSVSMEDMKVKKVEKLSDLSEKTTISEEEEIHVDLNLIRGEVIEEIRAYYNSNEGSEYLIGYNVVVNSNLQSHNILVNSSILEERSIALKESILNGDNVQMKFFTILVEDVKELFHHYEVVTEKAQKDKKRISKDDENVVNISEGKTLLSADVTDKEIEIVSKINDTPISESELKIQESARVQFIKFLKDEGVYDEYIKLNNNLAEIFEDFNDISDAENYMFDAFHWVNEDYDKWFSLNYKWRELIKQKQD